MRMFFLSLLGLILLVSCGKQPESICSVDKTEALVGEQIQFTGSQSTEAYYYHWKFGDGTESRDADPVHTFESAGTYEVILHVSNKGGDSWDNNDDALSISVYGYNRALSGVWNVNNQDTSLCGTLSNNYSLTLSESEQLDEVIIQNLGDRISADITGHVANGNPNKLEINAYNVVSKTGTTYHVTGNITLSQTLIYIFYILEPSPGDTCGNIRGHGVGVH